MCGICGQLRFDHKSVQSETLSTMMSKIARRGPDASGQWAEDKIGFGHQRLSIIDLSNYAAQPMVDDSLGLVLVFNGTIYNYQSLRQDLIKKGYTFFSHSDTEVIIKAYHFWGEDCVTHLDGMFAFVIWDGNNGWVARDKFGEKPIYYAYEGNGIFTSSELGALAKILNKQYSVLIFGQTYQFSWDWVKYTFLWKKHLKEIVNSCQGYKDVIPLTPPNIKFKNRVMIEFLSLIRYYFIRNAHNTYTLSSQVKWECEKVYKINPKVLRAGFSNTVLDQRIGLYKNKVNDKSIINFVMLSRLAKKKRVDVAIKSFQNIKLSRKWHLTIIGGGAEFENLTRLTKSLNLQDNVTLMGRVTDDILHKKHFDR